MCHFGERDGRGLICDSGSDIPACQLCPTSITYWRNTDNGAAANPWDGGGQATVAEPAASTQWDGWPKPAPKATAAEGWTTGPTRACILCSKPTTLYSPRLVPCHMGCAAAWNNGERVFARPR